ncbi:hypothetical protein [Ancylobacter sp.]|uniref:hypothetical protein n=1 Tax=Ancylobacter sp. TaxID=1872567 RepID=UPI003D0A5442
MYGFQEMATAFDAAQGPSRLLRGTLGGHDLTTHFVGESLRAAIGPVFDYLTGGGAGRQGAAVKLWDVAATEVTAPPVPDEAERDWAGPGWRLRWFGSGRYLCEERPSSLLWLDREERQLIGCFADSRALERGTIARPLQRMMSLFCRSLGIQEIHAGLLARDGCGALLVGPGGRGKSTTTIDGLASGLDFLGDDSVGLGDGPEGSLAGHCLYASARVMPGQMERWPRLRPYWLPPLPTEQKHLLLPSALPDTRLAQNVRIVATILPRYVGNGVRFYRGAPIEAYHALVRDSRDNRRFGMTETEARRFARLTRETAIYHLEVDRDPAQVAAACLDIIERSS